MEPTMSDVLAMMKASIILKNLPCFFGYVDENGVFFTSSRQFNAVIKFIRTDQTKFGVRGQLKKIRVVSEPRMQLTVNGVPFVHYIEKRYRSDTPAPAECYRIHLTEQDNANPEVPDYEISENLYINNIGDEKYHLEPDPEGAAI